MAKIFSSAALRTKQREIKDIARNELVHITENGNAAFVFCSEDVLETLLEQERESALYEARLLAAVDRAEEDMAAGRYVSDIEKAREQGRALRRK